MSEKDEGSLEKASAAATSSRSPASPVRPSAPVAAWAAWWPPAVARPTRRRADHHDAAAATTTTAAPTTTTTAARPRTVSAVETGREVKIGFVTPLTGNISACSVFPTSTASSGRRKRSATASSAATARSTPSPSRPSTASPTRDRAVPGDRRPDQQRQGRHGLGGLHTGHCRAGGRTSRSHRGTVPHL